MFFGDGKGGRTAAVLPRFVALCRRVGVNPFAWFKDVLGRIGAHPVKNFAELLAQMAAAQA